MQNSVIAKIRSAHNLVLVVIVVCSISLIALCGLIVSSVWTNRVCAVSDVHISGKGINVCAKVAKSSADQEKGLAGKRHLYPREGMLFVFPKDDVYGFWMKDMKVNIDIVWIDKRYRVVGIKRDISPSTYPATFMPAAKSRYVLELGANRSVDLRVGDVLEFNPANP